MKWKYVKSLGSEINIDNFECLAQYSFPENFRRCVLQYNGGRPNKRSFDTGNAAGREIKTFLSFNNEDRENIWAVFEWNREELGCRYIAFAIDNYGNLIYFDKKNHSIVFVEHETVDTEYIAGTFNLFMEILYE